MLIEPYIPLCKAICTLFNPLVEVVIHDIATNRILYIYGALSTRDVGDDSNLELDLAAIDSEIDQITYPKLNFDGRLIKSISVPLKENGETKAILCINCDVSLFSQLQSLATQFLPGSINTQPASLFKNDWQEKLHWAIHQYLDEKSLEFKKLTPTHKKKLVYHLYEQGAFREKKAPDYIAEILLMGRATIFKYLKEIKNDHRPV